MGSNTQQEENFRHVREILSHLISDATFSQTVWTHPVSVEGREVGREPYLNGTLEGHTHISEQSLVARLKQIEKSMGDSHENHVRGTVLIDLDLIEYGNKKLKDIIWK